MDRNEYLNFIRQENKKMMSVCHFCSAFAINLKAEGYKLLPVCKNHLDQRDLEDVENNISKIIEDRERGR